MLDVKSNAELTTLPRKLGCWKQLVAFVATKGDDELLGVMYRIVRFIVI